MIKMTEEKSSMELENQLTPSEETEVETSEAETIAEDVTQTEEDTSEKVDQAQEKENEAFKVSIPEDVDEIPEKNAEKAAEAIKIVEKTPVRQTQRPRKRVPARNEKQIKSEKKAKNTVIILSCLMALITAVTAVLGATTDIFKADDVKAVAVLILPQEDKEELEKHLSKIRSLAETGFDTEKMSGEEIFSYIRPGSEGGLYTCFGYTAEKISDLPDPSERFTDEAGEYAYYKISSKEIDSILSHFDLETNHSLNSEKAYYYDGHYYFAYEESDIQTASGEVSVVDSKRIQDGRYYVTCNFGNKEVYVIASIVSTDEGNLWKIHSMSLKPVFDSLGIMIKNEDKTAGKYEMRQLILEAKAKNGTVYMKYVLKYPYFFGESQGEIQANNFYSSLMTYYRQQSAQAQSDYNKFIKKGGKAQSLPLELHYTATVSLFDEKNLCIINEITESVPMYEDTEETEVNLGSKTVECNTFDIETGLFVSKDSLIGKDYVTLSEILYRIYSGYDYESLLDETVASEDVPEDTENLGEKIYDSAVAMRKDGYVFCFVNEDGLREDVVVPFEAIEKLNQE
jgi:hypothetical protein